MQIQRNSYQQRRAIGRNFGIRRQRRLLECARALGECSHSQQRHDHMADWELCSWSWKWGLADALPDTCRIHLSKSIHRLGTHVDCTPCDGVAKPRLQDSGRQTEAFSCNSVISALSKKVCKPDCASSLRLQCRSLFNYITHLWRSAVHAYSGRHGVGGTPTCWLKVAHHMLLCTDTKL